MTASTTISPPKSPPPRAVKAAAKEMSKAIRKQGQKQPTAKQVAATADKYIPAPDMADPLPGALDMKTEAQNLAHGQKEAFTPAETGQIDARSVAADQLRTVVERIERLEEEKKSLGANIKDVYGEAKANGFDGKALRKIISLRRLDRDQRMEEEAMVELYKQALGMD